MSSSLNSTYLKVNEKLLTAVPNSTAGETSSGYDIIATRAWVNDNDSVGGGYPSSFFDGIEMPDGGHRYSSGGVGTVYVTEGSGTYSFSGSCCGVYSVITGSSKDNAVQGGMGTSFIVGWEGGAGGGLFIRVS